MAYKGAVCSPRCFDYWSRLLALAGARPDDARLRRRDFLAASAVPFVAAACASTPAPSGQTRDLLDSAFSFDLHSHPGLFKSMSNDTLAGHRRSAEAGGVKLIALTATSDALVIAVDRSGALRQTREPKPGELHASMYRQIDALVKWSGAAALVDHGYRPDEAAKVLGGNARRVFQKVGAAAAPRSGG